MTIKVPEKLRARDLDRVPDSATSPTRDADSKDGVRRTTEAIRPGVVNLFPQQREAIPIVWRVGAAASVGRSRQADVRLDDDKISRIHAHLESKPKGIRVRDNGSRHGSFI